MSFFNRIKNGFAIVGLSFDVIQKNKGVWFYPFFSISLWLIIIAFVSAVTYGFYEWHIFDPQTIKTIMELPHDDPRRMKFNLLATSILFLLYFFGAIIMAFTGVALTSYVIAIFNGEKITIGQSLNDALSRFGTIVGWAFLSATVGIILDMLQGKKGKENIAYYFIGQAFQMAWSLLTFFVIPVISQEKLGVYGSIKRSGTIMKDTFGEFVGGQAGFGLLTLTIALLALLVGMGLEKLMNLTVGLSFAVPFFIISIIAINIATTIFQAAVYQYAHKKATGSFTSLIIKQSFTQKN
jgi:Family of unknown function (DUF6159)